MLTGYKDNESLWLKQVVKSNGAVAITASQSSTMVLEFQSVFGTIGGTE